MRRYEVFWLRVQLMTQKRWNGGHRAAEEEMYRVRDPTLSRLRKDGPPGCEIGVGV